MFALCLELQPAEVRNAFVSLDIALCPNYRFPGFLLRGRVARCIRAIIFVFVCFSFTSSLGVGYLMVCTASYPNVLAFCFLDELQKEFIVTYDTKRIESAMRPYSFIEFGESVELCVSAETTMWEIWCQLFKLKRVPCLMVPIRCKIGLILYNIQFLKFLLGSAQILQYGVTVSKFQIQKKRVWWPGTSQKVFYATKPTYDFTCETKALHQSSLPKRFFPCRRFKEAFEDGPHILLPITTTKTNLTKMKWARAVIGVNHQTKFENDHLKNLDARQLTNRQTNKTDYIVPPTAGRTNLNMILSTDVWVAQRQNSSFKKSCLYSHKLSAQFVMIFKFGHCAAGCQQLSYFLSQPYLQDAGVSLQGSMEPTQLDLLQSFGNSILQM